MRTRMAMILAGVALSAAASSAAFAEGQMETIVPTGTLNWVPCDPKAAQPDACQFAFFRGDPAKEPHHRMIQFKAGFTVPPHWHTSNEHLVMTKGTMKVAAEGGQEQGIVLKAGDYLFLPARNVHWVPSTDGCVFYLYVDGPDSYFDAKAQRP